MVGITRLSHVRLVLCQPPVFKNRVTSPLTSVPRLWWTAQVKEKLYATPTVGDCVRERKNADPNTELRCGFVSLDGKAEP